MTPTCPHCGKPVPESAPGGICPECMLKVGASATGEAAPGETLASRTPPEPPTLEEIARLFPQFEILGSLGRGGMGAVYKARQPRLDRTVALKILLPGAGTDIQGTGLSERFAREARALAQLSHPNIVGVYDFGETGGYLYLVMEYVDGVNLRQMMQSGKLTPVKALAIVPRICEALQYAHEKGVIHRDIKPENILVDQAGQVKIADFGIAKVLRPRPEDDALTREHHVIGTPHYMAPEQVEHPLAVDHRADIYSLGVVFYEMLTGELPIGRFAPPSRKVKIDVRLDDVVLHALEKEPARRYQHASEVKTDVEGISRGPAPLAASPAMDERRRRILNFGLVCCLIGLPAGLMLHLPYVTVLSVIGLVVVSLKLTGNWPSPSLMEAVSSPSQRPPVPPGAELTPAGMALLYFGVFCCVGGLGVASMGGLGLNGAFRAFLVGFSLIGLGLILPAIVLRRRVFLPAPRSAAPAPRQRRGPLYWVVTILLGGFGLLILLAVLAILASLALPALQRARMQKAEAGGSIGTAMEVRDPAQGVRLVDTGDGVLQEAVVLPSSTGSKTTVYGPVHEVTLAGEGDDQPRLLDLDSGQTFSLAEALDRDGMPTTEAMETLLGDVARIRHLPIELMSLRRRHGVDVVAYACDSPGGLIGLQLMTGEVPNEAWDRSAPGLNFDALVPPEFGNDRTTLKARTDGVATYEFRTPSNQGILQILRANHEANPPTVSLRYRLLEDRER